MNYGEIKDCDIANGVGVRVSLFVSGCTHHCEGCFNPMTWDFNYGSSYSSETEEKIITMLSRNYIRGLTLLGGEPLEYENQKALLPLLKRIKTDMPQKDLWCYTGYTFETDILKDMFSKYSETKELMSFIDVLVDGEFIQDKKNVSLKFRGSDNQRIINVPLSIEKGETVLWNG